MKQAKAFAIQDPDANVTHMVVLQSDYEKVVKENIDLKEQLRKNMDISCLYKATQELIYGAKAFLSQMESYEKVSRERITADEMNKSQEMVKEIIAATSDVKDFDPTFLVSIGNAISSGKILTYGQYGALSRTHYHFTKKKKSKGKPNAKKSTRRKQNS